MRYRLIGLVSLQLLLSFALFAQTPPGGVEAELVFVPFASARQTSICPVRFDINIKKRPSAESFGEISALASEVNCFRSLPSSLMVKMSVFPLSVTE